jgi:hypothetical protein
MQAGAGEAGKASANLVRQESGLNVAKRNASTFALNARRQIAQELKALAILSVPRSSALVNYLAVLEAESVKATVFSAGSPMAALGAHRQAVESSAHAIPAISSSALQMRASPNQIVIHNPIHLSTSIQIVWVPSGGTNPNFLSTLSR